MRRALALILSLLLAASAPFAAGMAQTGEAGQPAGEGVAAAPSAPAQEAEPGSLDRLVSWLEQGYAEEPALVIALAAVLVLSPIISVVALATVSASRARERRRARREAPLRQAMEAADAAQPPSSGSRPSAAARRTAAFQVLGEDATSLPLRGTMVRIGRHEENDIRLASKTVHRYHAVLHVTPELQYVLTDLSGREGNGVIVNGERMEQATLKAEDVIELGEVKLRFSLGEAAAA